MRGGAAFLILGVCLAGGPALAGAWPVAPGQVQAIAKFEQGRADQAFDGAGDRVRLGRRVDGAWSLYAEGGITSRLTWQGKASYVRGHDLFSRYDGRGPTEIGLRYAAVDSGRAVVSLYAGAILAGAGRKAGYARPGIGSTDYEVRVLAGRSGVALGRPVFGEVQAARIDRAGLADETRLDATLGVDVSPDWLVLAQTYAGRADRQGLDRPQWLKGELSVVRRFGDWRLQAGWREAILGRDVPVDNGAVIGVWKAF